MARIVQEGQSLDISTLERTQLQHLMRRAGLLVEPSPAIYASAEQSTLTLDEAIALLSRGDGPSLSEQLDEARGRQE